MMILFFFFFQAEDGIRDLIVTGVQTCALPILRIDADASKPDYRVGDFALPTELGVSRTQDRRDLLQSLDDQIRKLESQPDVDAMGSHYRRAFSLLASREATQAFDLTREPQSVR